MSIAEPTLAQAALSVAPQAGRPLPIAKIFHWATAILVVIMFASGIVMTQLSGGPVSDFLYTAHKSTGALVLVLVVLRITYRVQARLRGRWLPQIGNHHAHRLMYAMLLSIPILGWLAVSDYGARALFFGLKLPEILPKGLGYSDWLFSAHAWMAFGLIALVLVHIGIALQDYIMRGEAGKLTK
jgi:cytochrome b561